LGLHLLVGVVEAFITFGAVAYLARVRPALLAVNGFELSSTPGRLSTATVAGSILVAALLLGGVGSLFASKLPDALDSLTGRNAQRQIVSNNEAPSITEATHLQEKTAPLPEYGVRGHDAWWSTSLAGVLGTLITLGVIWAIGRFLHKTESQNPKTEIHSHASG